VQDEALSSFPTVSDGFWLSFYPCSFAAIALLVRERLRAVEASLWLDGFIAGTTIAALGIELVLDQIVSSRDPGSSLGWLIAYPLVDLTVLGLLIVVWGASRWRMSLGPLCLTLGFLVLLVTDAVSVDQLSKNDYAPGTLVDSGWLTAMALIGFASSQRWSWTLTFERSFGWPLFVVPLTAVLSALTILTLDSINNEHGAGFVLACAVVLLVVFRLFVSLRENANTARELRDARDRFEKAFEDAPIGMVMVGIGSDDFGRFIEVNRAFCKVTGYSEEELLESDVVVLTHPDDRDETIENMRAVARGAVARIELEKRYVRADGEVIWVQVNSSAVTDQSGDALYSLAQVQDITERKHYEREHELLSAIIDSSEDAIFSKTPQGVITTWNPGAEKLYGFTAAEACGRSIDELIIPEHLPGDEMGVIRQVLSGQPVKHYETERRRKDGTPVTVSLSASAVRDSEGQTVGISVIGRDITERKRHERELLQDVGDYAWLQRVRTALDEQHLCLYTQPIMDLRTGEFTREEILLRMRGQRGENDIIAPAEFLPIAEKFDLVGDIDRWIITETIPLLAGDREIEMNLSARSIGDPKLTRLIEKLVIESGVDPSKLTVEITETAVMSDLQAARVFAERLERLGCALALDDLGTGYGSFTYLKHLPVQYLKIDIQFIRDLVNSKPDQRIVRSIVGVAKYFGVKTIAEGVESKETLDLLTSYGVDYAQGYYLGRPAPVAVDPLTAVDGPPEAVV
jgi:PAS domain S-box-containing protein